jgi:hypothetical protein
MRLRAQPDVEVFSIEGVGHHDNTELAVGRFEGEAGVESASGSDRTTVTEIRVGTVVARSAVVRTQSGAVGELDFKEPRRDLRLSIAEVLNDNRYADNPALRF